MQANTTSDTGGGLSCHDRSSPALTNCVIADNTSLRSGGGLHCREDSSPTLTNCTVQGNTSDRGGGIHCSASLPNLTNCILWGNSPEQIDLVDGSDITIAFSDIQGGWLGAGNIDADPGFRSFGGLDWLLRPGSPCIDTGSLLLEDGISDWHPRWPDRYRNGPRSDMGAFGGPGNSGWLP